jgi:hypothetical protein
MRKLQLPREEWAKAGVLWDNKKHAIRPVSVREDGIVV